MQVKRGGKSQDSDSDLEVVEPVVAPRVAAPKKPDELDLVLQQAPVLQRQVSARDAQMQLKLLRNRQALEEARAKLAAPIPDIVQISDDGALLQVVLPPHLPATDFSP